MIQTRIAEGGGRLARAALAGLALALAAEPAEARTEQLRWTHPDPQAVAAFRVYTGSSSRQYATTQDVVSPSADASGVFSYDLDVADDAVVYVAVTALDGDGIESDYSNEKILAPAPSEPGATLWSDGFDSLALGTSPAGWIDTGANNSLQPDDTLFSVMSINANRVFGTTSTATNIHSHYVTGSSTGWSGYELRGRMRIDDFSGGIGVTAHSLYTSSDAYYRLRRYEGNAFHLAPHGRATLSCSASDTGVVPQPGTWYRFRFQVAPSSQGVLVSAKVWADGATEPPAWQASCFDANPGALASGVPGVWSMGPGGKYWDDLEAVALGGSVAPPPPPAALGAPGQPVLVP